MKTSLTASEHPSSIVNLSRSQSQEDPSFFICSMIVPPYSSFQSQARSKNFSLPRSSFSIPSSFSALMIFTSVAILAWSVPGIHNALYPCIFLKRIRMSWSVSSNACPIWSFPVIFGGGITIVYGCFVSSTSAWKYLLSSHFWYRRSSIAPGSYVVSNSFFISKLLTL